MRDQFTVDFDHLAQSVLQKRAYRLADVEHRLERVAYDIVRFRDNQDTDQLWKVQDGPEGPVIVALYGDDGGLVVDSERKQNDWEAIPDKKSMHIYYKGEPLVSLSSRELGIPTDEFNVARRWLPAKLASDESFQEAILKSCAKNNRRLIAQRFPELIKVAMPTGELTDEDDDNVGLDEAANLITMVDADSDLKDSVFMGDDLGGDDIVIFDEESVVDPEEVDAILESTAKDQLEFMKRLVQGKITRKGTRYLSALSSFGANDMVRATASAVISDLTS